MGLELCTLPEASAELGLSVDTVKNAAVHGYLFHYAISYPDMPSEASDKNLSSGRLLSDSPPKGKPLYDEPPLPHLLFDTEYLHRIIPANLRKQCNEGQKQALLRDFALEIGGAAMRHVALADGHMRHHVSNELSSRRGGTLGSVEVAGFLCMEEAELHRLLPGAEKGWVEARRVLKKIRGRYITKTTKNEVALLTGGAAQRLIKKDVGKVSQCRWNRASGEEGSKERLLSVRLWDGADEAGESRYSEPVYPKREIERIVMASLCSGAPKVTDREVLRVPADPIFDRVIKAQLAQALFDAAARRKNGRLTITDIAGVLDMTEVTLGKYGIKGRGGFEPEEVLEHLVWSR